MRALQFIGLAVLALLGTVGCSKKSDTAVLEGKWAVVAMTGASPDEIKGMTWSVIGNQITGTNPGGPSGKMSFKLVDKSQPKTIDFTALDGNRQGQTDVGIYSLEQDRLRVCLSTANSTVRPAELRETEKSWIMEFKRMER